MSYIKELGQKAFGSRLKNLSDTLMQDVLKVYKEVHVDFEPRWFTIFQLLLEKKAVPITEIAKELEQSHPAVVQVVNVLEKKRLVVASNDPQDHRKRLISLSKKGIELAHDLQETWDDVFEATDELLKESDPEFLEHIAQLENAYAHKSMYARVRDKIKSRMIRDINFIPYQGIYQEVFSDLNRDWLEEFLDVTPYDSKVLADPLTEIINKSGSIHMVMHGNDIIGSLAIRKVDTHACELLKFTIKKEFRGLGLGKHMLYYAIKIAEAQNYQKMLLFTHDNLKTATNLYKQTGFQDIKEYIGLSEPSGRCSILMELNINPKNI